MKQNSNSNRPKRSCSMCVNSRSTLGVDPHLYCSFMSPNTALPSRVCPSFRVAFVGGFFIPCSNLKEFDR